MQAFKRSSFKVKGGLRQYSVRDTAAHTKPKFRLVTMITPPCSFHTQLLFQMPDNLGNPEVKQSDLYVELVAAGAEV